MKKPIIDNSLTKTRSLQDTSCNWTGTTDFGRLVPFHVEELIPSEKVVTCRPRIEMQMLPLASPTFGKLDIYCHYFFVPTRLCWNAANDFFSRQGSMKSYLPPFFYPHQFYTYYNGPERESYKRSIFKHLTSMGLPSFFGSATYSNTTSLNKDQLSWLPLRAYQQIWWDFYRDPEVLRDDVKSNYITRDSANCDPNTNALHANQLLPRYRSLKDNWIANLFAQSGSSPDSFFSGLIVEDPDDPYNVITQDEDPNHTAQQLRKIEALTRLAERLSLGGKRQIDALFAAYGVKPEFMKLEMCQYIGGAKSTVMVADITSSADTSVSSEQGLPLGAKAGAGYCALDNLSIEYTANESGYLIGILSVMPHVHFVQGFNKMWYRNKIEDWFTKTLERTGQVAVAKKEIAADQMNLHYERNQDNNTFAFTQPYYEYKRGHDILAGDFLYYHNLTGTNDDEVLPEYQYMHSMEMYVDYPSDRTFNANNLLIDPLQYNKIFYYLGAGIRGDGDDHFHLCIDKEVKKDSPADGYAVPTIETTEDPHKTASNIGSDVVL